MQLDLSIEQRLRLIAVCDETKIPAHADLALLRLMNEVADALKIDMDGALAKEAGLIARRIDDRVQVAWDKNMNWPIELSGKQASVLKRMIRGHEWKLAEYRGMISPVVEKLDEMAALSVA